MPSISLCATLHVTFLHLIIRSAATDRRFYNTALYKYTFYIYVVLLNYYVTIT